jgi:hypothetical protein
MSDNRDHGTALAILEGIQHIRDYASSISNAEEVWQIVSIKDEFGGKRAKTREPRRAHGYSHVHGADNERTS